MDKTAIVILNWNGIDFLKKFLGSVVENSALPDTGIYVADNASTDGSVAWVAENYKDVCLIELPENYGFAGGYNHALAYVEAEYYVLLNSDIEVTPGWLEPLVEFMDANPDVASCQPKILSYSHKDQFEHAGAAGCYIDKYGFPFCRGRIFHRAEDDRGQYDSEASVFWTSGACMIMRSEAWKKCGGFDADFFAHMEEIDLCWRFHRAGFRVCFIPSSKVYHVGGGTLPYSSPFKVYLNFRNSLFMLYKNLPSEGFRRRLFMRKAIDGAAAAMFIFKLEFRCFLAVLNAHIDYYRSSRKLRPGRIQTRRLGTDNFSSPVLNKSVVFEFYIKRKRSFSSLNTEL